MTADENLTPYYDEDGITIYHADCADVLPLVPPEDVDLVLTDPPYGINYKPGPYWNYQGLEGDNVSFDPRYLLTRYNRLVLFGANNYTRWLPSGGWLIWDKRDMVSRRLPGSDGEMAWTDIHRRVHIIKHLWMPHTMRDEPLLHPTQKPVALMRYILDEWSTSGELVLDPYMGSGPVAQACRDLGQRYIGIEIEERYCEIAVQRLAQQVLPLEAYYEDHPETGLF